MRLVIYDDNKEFLKALKKLINEVIETNHILLKSIHCNNIIEFMENNEIFENDFIILGISQKQNYNGKIVNLVKKLKEEKRIYLLLLANTSNDISNYLSINKFVFISKENLNLKSLTRVIISIHKNYIDNQKYLFVTKENEYVQINGKEILYIKIENRHVCLKTTFNKIIELKERIFANVKEDFSKNNFIQIYKAMIVNLQYIDKLNEFNNNMELVLVNGEIINVSRNHKKNVKNKILNYWN